MDAGRDDQGRVAGIAAYQHAGRTDRGSREQQEDAFCLRYFQRRGGTTTTATPGCVGELVAVLADGMGGHVGGATASRIACYSFMYAYPRLRGIVRERLVHALDASNKAVAAATEEDQRLRGMGCTLIAVSIEAGQLRWVSVGDSLLFLFRNNRLVRLNEDHSLAPILDELVAQGELSADDARKHPKRNMLRSAVTGDEVKLVDLNDDAVPLQGGDWLILASDGVMSLASERIAAIVRREGKNGAERLAEALINAVKKRGDPEQDNTTIVVIGFDEVKN
jgi:protein phosphatase